MLWHCRNQVVHKGTRCDASILAARVRRLSWEDWQAWRRKLHPAETKRWKPPPEKSVKVNIDVAIRENFAVLAALIRDHKGQLWF